MIPGPLRPEPPQPWQGADGRAEAGSHDGLGGRLASAGVRGLVRFAHWRGRRDAARDLKRAGAPAIRGFIQINLIRPR